METLFTPEYLYLWVALLALALFLPVRQLIWVMMVRRAIGKSSEDEVDADEKQRLRKRANVTAGLLCCLFSLGYVNVLFAV